jgi:malonate decarboxylase epsilon subunit
MNVAFVFPGQGAQDPGLPQLIPDHPAAEATLAEAAGYLGRPVELAVAAAASTRSVQLALLVAGVAAARALQAEGSSPDLVAGLSVGAFAAAVVADAIGFADALALVELRGRLMAEAYPSGYGMAAIVGLSERRVAQLLAQVGRPAAPVFLANVNAPQQMVIAGSDAGLEQALTAAQAAGAVRTERLAVSVPSHCALLAGPARELSAALAPIALRPPRCPYLSNRRARALTDPAAIREDLATNLMYPVRWHDAMASAYERGVRLFVALPPGRVLTALLESAWPDARAVALDRSSHASISTLIAQARAR